MIPQRSPIARAAYRIAAWVFGRIGNACYPGLGIYGWRYEAAIWFWALAYGWYEKSAGRL